MSVSVWMLPHLRWALLSLPLEEREEVGRMIDRLERDPKLRKARPIGGTKRLYRLRCGPCRILYVDEGQRIIIVGLSSAPRGLPARFRRGDDLEGGVL
jgi:mRNA-degrading endonuclease RelE of RelBE toxin-antitoxin system